MFKTLGNTLQEVGRFLGKQAFLTEENIAEGVSLMRRSLLEADVALPVVQSMLQTVKEKAIGNALSSNTSAQKVFVRIMREELTQVLGGNTEALDLRAVPPVVVLLVGMQGVGKTTTVAKLAAWIKQHKKKQILVASCDLQRPAAIEQLRTLAQKISVDDFSPPFNEATSVVDRARAAVTYAEQNVYDVLLLDTAGRGAMDDVLMAQMAAIHAAVKPIETLLVVDAMMGQAALTVAEAFHGKVPLSGLILTKADSDTRGGAALSAKHITNTPIKFIAQGEAVDAFDIFHPDRIAARILGLSDIASFAEEVERKVDHGKQMKLSKKLKAGGVLSLDDFRLQLDEIVKMGGLSSILEKLPIGDQSNKLVGAAQQQNFRRFAVMIDSMTKQERRHPEMLNPSRKQRIAKGSGHAIHHVNSLLKQFKQMQKMLKKTNKPGGMKNMQRMIQSLSGNSGVDAHVE